MAGESPKGAPTTEASDDGVDPDPNGDSDPTEAGEGDPTPVAVPVLGLAKRVTSRSDVGGGQFDVTFQIWVENLGTEELVDVQVVDDLAATFPAPATFSVQTAPTTALPLVADPSFDGVAQTSLLDATSSTLGVGASGTITLTVRFDPQGLPGPFFNQAGGSGIGSDSMRAVADLSDDGADPDPNSDCDPGGPDEDDATPIDLGLGPGEAEILKSAVSNDENGDSFAQVGETVSYVLTVTNVGLLTLTDVAVTDPLVVPVTCPPGNPIPSLSPGVTIECHGDYTLSAADIAAGEVVNTAVAAGIDLAGAPVSDDDRIVTPSWCT